MRLLVLFAVASFASAQTSLLSQINDLKEPAVSMWQSFAKSSRESCEFARFVTEKSHAFYLDVRYTDYIYKAVEELLVSSGFTRDQLRDSVGDYFSKVTEVNGYDCDALESQGPLDLLTSYDNIFGSEGVYWNLYYTLRNHTDAARVTPATQAELKQIYCNPHLQEIAEKVYDAGLDFFSFIFQLLFFFLDIDSVIICD